MSDNPKRPNPSARPVVPSVAPPGAQRPSNVRDALREAHAVAGGALARPSTSSNAMAAGRRKTVLVVDDDSAMRSKLKSGLSPFYDVLEAKDGMEAVELTSSIQPPAMIVCDVIMPRVDGFTLAKILRGNPIMRRVPIMFVSSRNSPQDVTQALVLGACQYVPKTTPVNDIVAKIRKIVA